MLGLRTGAPATGPQGAKLNARAPHRARVTACVNMPRPNAARVLLERRLTPGEVETDMHTRKCLTTEAKLLN